MSPYLTLNYLKFFVFGVYCGALTDLKLEVLLSSPSEWLGLQACASMFSSQVYLSRKNSLSEK